MKHLPRISGSTAALLALALTGLILVLAYIPVPLFPAIVICVVSIFLSLLGLGSERWRFKGYALFSIAVSLCVVLGLIHNAAVPRAPRLRPVPPSVTVQGFSITEAEQLYDSVQAISREQYWAQVRHDLTKGRLKNAWIHYREGQAVLKQMAKTSDQSASVTLAKGTNTVAMLVHA